MSDEPDFTNARITDCCGEYFFWRTDVATEMRNGRMYATSEIRNYPGGFRLPHNLGAAPKTSAIHDQQ